MKKLKHRNKQRRKQLNHALITFGNKKLRGRYLQSVDKKGRVRTKDVSISTDIYNRGTHVVHSIYKGELL